MSGPPPSGREGAAPAGAGSGAPLVTFALFAYNQERFVRDAVRGALAQDYSPMEIVLSDDCSRDGTFDAMRQEAAGYRGPNQVVVRRNPSNLGLAGHIDAVLSTARGSIILPAGGDDVSLAGRTPACVAAFRERPGLVAVACRTKSIDDVV